MTDNNRESFTFEIVEHICKLGQTREDGFTKEFNRVSFRGLPPKWDIREWNHNHTRMTKGITLTDSEMALMLDALAERKERLKALREKREATEMQRTPANEAAEMQKAPASEAADRQGAPVQEAAMGQSIATQDNKEAQSTPAQETAKEQGTTAQEYADNQSLPAQETAEEHAPSVQEPKLEPVSAPDSEDLPASVLDSDDEYVPSHDVNLF
ncbi:MAG: hypothetical protein E7225_01500 [Clostridiales bacterium]|nr:hypothetical protein [Clostridiales bacterium]